MRHNIQIKLEMERYPRYCKECPSFHEHPYTCHNEFGFEGECMLGYMSGHDMRDFRGLYRFKGCKIETDPRVLIMKGETND